MYNWGDGKEIVLRSSGTTGDAKFVVLSQKAVLHSARMVNQFISSSDKDCWLRALPLQHIGGLSILARAHLSGARVIPWDEKWNPEEFVNVLKKNKVTLVSLVPTQVHDIVRQQLQAPKFLRVVFVGGGSLNEQDYRIARQLGWPLLPTYGMSESASQVATAPLESLAADKYPGLQVLPHWEVDVGENGSVALRGPSLFSYYLVKEKGGESQLFPFQDGWFLTQDRGVVKGGKFHFLGRISEEQKVNGHLINAHQVNQEWQAHFRKNGTQVMLVPDRRSENLLALISEHRDLRSVEERLVSFNQGRRRPEQLRSIYYVDKIPRNDLGKVQIKQVFRILGLDG